jgi:hypothetical protein
MAMKKIKIITLIALLGAITYGFVNKSYDIKKDKPKVGTAVGNITLKTLMVKKSH